MAIDLTRFYSYTMLLQDNIEKSVVYLRLLNKTEDPKTYELSVRYSFEILQRDYFSTHEVDLDAWLNARAGHTFNYYLVYAPFDTVIGNAEPNDILDWTISSRVLNDEGVIIFEEHVRLRDVISESGVWTYERDQAIEDNKYTVLDTGMNPYTTL